MLRAISSIDGEFIHSVAVFSFFFFFFHFTFSSITHSVLNDERKKLVLKVNKFIDLTPFDWSLFHYSSL